MSEVVVISNHPDAPCYLAAMATEQEAPRERDEKRAARALGLVEVAERALRQFAELSGHVPESLTGARQDGDGWSLLVDVVEVERVPATMSVLASYRIDVDRQGDLVSYERLRRFTRLATD